MTGAQGAQAIDTASPDTGPVTSGDHRGPAGPRRVLTVSADMGGGHNATAAALEELVGTLWPGSEIRRLDTLDVLGPGVGPLFRRIYVGNVQGTPWLYEFFYASLWRHRWFAAASKQFIGSWCGRRLAPQLERFDPDLILSTYPLGSAGLAWLRRNRGLAVPTAAYVSDFAPHPFWIYRDLDANFVLHDVALPLAQAAEPGANTVVCAPPVLRAFAPGDGGATRDRLGIGHDAFVVLVSCGAYSFGHVDAVVGALLDAGPQVCVVVACGRNEEIRAQLEALHLPPRRLTALGWTDHMADLIRAADLVVGNAGGAIALETLACGRPLLLASPIAAHGQANADLMAVTGLAELVQDTDRLTAHVRSLLEDPGSLSRARDLTATHMAGVDLSGGVDAMARMGASPPANAADSPLRPSDAFFSHLDRPAVRQELGVVLELGEVAPGEDLSVEAVRAVFDARTAGLPTLRRELRRDPRASWHLVPTVAARDHIGFRPAPEGMDAALDEFWSEPLPADGPAWRAAVIRDDTAGRTVLTIKLHHALGDGVSMLGLLDRVLDPLAGDRLLERGRPVDLPTRRREPVTEVLATTARRAADGLAQTASGLASLAARGRAPRHPANRAVADTTRHVVQVGLPARQVKQLARTHHVNPPEFVLAVVADALGRILRHYRLAADGVPLRVMFPVSVRPLRLDHIFGNWTGSVALDLPIAEMPFPERLALVRAELRLRLRRGEPQAANAVMRLAGHLPRAAHRAFARTVYGRRFFNTIVSYMPGARGPRTCAGAPVLGTYPVLPLAPSVPLAVGVIMAGDVAGVGLVSDAGFDRSILIAAVRDAYATAGGVAAGGGGET